MAHPAFFVPVASRAARGSGGFAASLREASLAGLVGLLGSWGLAEFVLLVGGP